MDPKDRSIFSKNVIARRKALGIRSTEKLAEIVGVHKNTIVRIEMGMSGGTVETREKIAAALGCTLGELYTDPEKTPPPSKIIAMQATLLAELEAELNKIKSEPFYRAWQSANDEARARALLILQSSKKN